MKIFPLAGYLLMMGASCFAQLSSPVESPRIPIPPAQTQPWSPPETKLAPVVVSAITELFNEGLSDPRGCDYREIEVAWGETTIKTHGWVLPGEGRARFAVGWNGVVYPLKTMGKPVDLQTDFPGKNPGAGFQELDHDWPISEWEGLSSDSLMPIKAALLLRVGRADLAEDLWRRGFGLHPDQAANDPYVLLANVWISALYERAMGAHLQGDDPLALPTCRILLPLQKIAEASAARRGIAKPAKNQFYFNTLQQLPELAADQERRAQEPPYTPVLASDLPAHGPERVAALVHDLELVSARQEMNPGQTDVSTDPIVVALIKEGDPAVEPLLKCFEEDTRLTRSEFTQGMQIRPGPIISVYEPAFVALVGILKTPFYFSDADNRKTFDLRPLADPRDEQPRAWSLDDRKVLAAKIRDYWQKNRGLSLPERWYATLQDDHAEPAAWFLAAANIVQPTNVMMTPSTMFGGGWTSGGGFPPNSHVVREGEILHHKTNPSVGELIIKRFKQLLVQSNSDKSITFDPMGKLILALADWDGPAHFDELREFTRDFEARFPHEFVPFSTSVQTEAALYQKRAELGDPHALEDYAEWITKLKPEDMTLTPLEIPFRVMWEHPNDPVIRQAAAKVFTDKASAWEHLAQQDTGALGDLLITPLLGLASFRQEIDRELTTSTVVGSVKLYDNGNVGITRNGSNSQEPDISCRLDPLAPAAGSIVEFRLCDYDAFRLSKIDGFPTCQLYWPQAQRDSAVAACRAFLHRLGDNFQYRAGDPDFRDTAERVVHIHFPKLDHPATPDEVKKGRAIFSLSGATRIYTFPDFPLQAWRPDRKTDPQPATSSNPDGTSKSFIMYMTEGRVWQAEEELVDGKWQRYYGFVGRYQLDKVPASEIEFYDTPYGGDLTPEIRAHLEGPFNPKPGDTNFMVMTHHFGAMDAAVPVVLKASNHSGLDQAVPDAVMLPPNATGTLPPGISLSLSYSEKLPPVMEGFSGPRFDYGPWQDLPMRKEIQVATTPTPGPMLRPTGELVLLKIDLRDFFDMSRPGSYRLKALFQVPGQPANKSNEIIFSIANAPH